MFRAGLSLKMTISSRELEAEERTEVFQLCNPFG